jgi:hypothetical protein
MGGGCALLVELAHRMEDEMRRVLEHPRVDLSSEMVWDRKT